MSGGGGSSTIFGAYAVIKAREPKPGERVEVQAHQAALDEEELQELEAELYGDGAGPAHANPEGDASSQVLHLPRPHLPKHG